jgi:formate hydrogenlyase transcriptional activator
MKDKEILSKDILIVDDEVSNLKLLTQLLSQQGYQVRPAERPQMAIDSALAHPPILILLDVKMPGMDGLEVCKFLKNDERTRDIPIIFISALQDVQDRVQGFEAGGVDFISKPFQEEEILARVGTHLDLRNLHLNLEQIIDERTAQAIESETRFRATFEQAAVGVAHVSTEGKFLRVNRQFCQIVGYSEEEMFGLSFQEITHADDLTDDLVFVGELLSGERESYAMDKRYYRKDGAIVWINLTVSLLFDRKGKAKYFVSVIKDISDRKQAENEVKQSIEEINKLQKQLQAESTFLQEEIKLEHNFENIIGQSESLKYVLHRIEMVAPQHATVLILGETGTGKELIARAVHQLSSRSKRPMVKVNCAALPRELIESELFGRTKGAFTGATTTQAGRFEMANGSTLFLDEIGELPFELQAKLLRVLESGEFERLGSSHTLHSDVRIIAATNRNIEEEIDKNRFREDLWYRLKVFPITLPPLRERTEDIPMLTNSFVQLLARKMGKNADTIQISKRSMQELESYPWPGNVRELKHIVEGALITMNGNKLHFDLPKSAKTIGTSNFKSLEEMEREYILEVLQEKNWKIEGKDSAASILGLNPSTLRSRLKKLDLKRP